MRDELTSGHPRRSGDHEPGSAVAPAAPTALRRGADATTARTRHRLPVKAGPPLTESLEAAIEVLCGQTSAPAAVTVRNAHITPAGLAETARRLLPATVAVTEVAQGRAVLTQVRPRHAMGALPGIEILPGHGLAANLPPVDLSGAACAGGEVQCWFPPDADEAAALAAHALDVCATCDVRTACRDAALVTSDLDGIWGGLRPSMRARWQRDIRRRLRLDRTPELGAMRQARESPGRWVNVADGSRTNLPNVQARLRAAVPPVARQGTDDAAGRWVFAVSASESSGRVRTVWLANPGTAVALPTTGAAPGRDAPAPWVLLDIVLAPTDPAAYGVTAVR